MPCHVPSNCPVISPFSDTIDDNNGLSSSSLDYIGLMPNLREPNVHNTVTLLLLLLSYTQSWTLLSVLFPPIRLLFITQTDKIKSYGKAFSFFAIRLFKEFVLLLLLPSPQFRVCVSTRKKKPLGLSSTVKLSFQHHRCPEKKNNFSFSSPYEHAVQSVWKKERKTQDFSFPLIKYTHTRTDRLNYTNRERERQF